MKCKLILPVAFSLVLSSCYTFKYNFVKQFHIIESDDGVFRSIPSADSNSTSFYFLLETGTETKLLYCSHLSNGYDIYFFQDVSVQPSFAQIIDTNCFLNRNKIELSMTNYAAVNYLKCEDLSGWNQIAHIRQANDNELDAKYYTGNSYKGLNDQLKLVYKFGQYGYIDDTKNTLYVYLGDSSIFTFKLFGEYNNHKFIFSFLDNEEFIINDEDCVKASGTYSSSRAGMTLHFKQNNMFEIDNNDLELEMYYDNDTFVKEVSCDLSQYIEDDAIFLK